MTDILPLSPPDADVRNLDGFMLNVERIWASEFWATSTGDEFKAAFALWCRAWKQVPAGSLPDDDKVLAGFSGAGKSWKKIRNAALHGFVKCSDGRLYHRVLCEDVKRALAAKDKYEGAREADRQRLKEWREAKREARQTAKETKTKRVSPDVSNAVSGDVSKQPRHTDETSNTGRDDKGNRDRPNPEASQQAAGPRQSAVMMPEWDDLKERCLGAIGATREDAGIAVAAITPIYDLLDAGWSWEKHILPKLQEMRAKGRRGSSWTYYANSIRGGLDAPAKAPPPPAEPPRETFRQKRERIWSQQLAAARRLGAWSDHWGAPPGSPSCEIPPEFVAAWEAANPQSGAAA